MARAFRQGARTVVSFVALFRGVLVAAIGARLAGPQPREANMATVHNLGRVVVVVLLLVALPGFIGAVGDILSVD
jgi:hypothetical protein